MPPALEFEERADQLSLSDIYATLADGYIFKQARRKLLAKGAKLLVGPRGTGKTHVMRYTYANAISDPNAPLRSLIFHAADRAVRDVYVDGEQVVANGRVLTLDQAGALERLTAAQRRMEASVPARDARGRRSTEITPLSLPPMP